MVYKRNPSLQNQKSPHNHKEWVEQLFVLDKNTIKLPNGKGDGAVIINGTIWETKNFSDNSRRWSPAKSVGTVLSLTGSLWHC